MLHLFRKTRTSRAEEKDVPPDGYTLPQSPEELLSTDLRRKLVDMIWQRTSLSATHFERLYLTPLKRFADLVQLLPASENHHHAYPGGMLDHGLEIVIYALKLRQSHLLPPGAAPEDQSSEAEAWTAGLTYAALLHDIGKIVVDHQVELASGNTWHPWNGPLAEPYRIKFVKGRAYHQHPTAGSLLTQQVLTPEILDWLMQTPTLFGALTYVLSGHYEAAGMLGELVIKADQASVSKAIGGNPARAIDIPKESLQGKLIHGLRHLVKNELRINQPGAAAWLTNDALWLVSKSVTDQLKAYLLSQGFEGVPHRNSRLFDEMQCHGIIQQTPANMAIWECTINDPERNWSQKLTMLKVAPALIWGTKQRPETFTGTVVVSADATGEHHTEADKKPTADADSHRPVRSQDQRTDSPPPAPPPYEDDELAFLMQSLDQAGEADRYSSLLNNLIEPGHETDAQQEIPALLPATARGGEMPEPQQNPGTLFVSWLRAGLLTQKIVINDVKAKVHTVSGTAFLVTPGIFQRFSMEHPNLCNAKDQREAWKEIQKQFQKLRLHKKTENGLNIWKCTVMGQKRVRKLQGYLMVDPLSLFTTVPHDNPFLALDVGE
ncbi:MobH family relaxase [Pseudomonas sp. Pseusp122]|uniref:MobH family relaxase n=1 Tax=unclassified Pseudomonas TaxID=196821 RepID=UPI0039A41132